MQPADDQGHQRTPAESHPLLADDGPPPVVEHRGLSLGGGGPAVAPTVTEHKPLASPAQSTEPVRTSEPHAGAESPNDTHDADAPSHWRYEGLSGALLSSVGTQWLSDEQCRLLLQLPTSPDVMEHWCEQQGSSNVLYAASELIVRLIRILEKSRTDQPSNTAQQGPAGPAAEDQPTVSGGASRSRSRIVEQRESTSQNDDADLSKTLQEAMIDELDLHPQAQSRASQDTPPAQRSESPADHPLLGLALLRELAASGRISSDQPRAPDEPDEPHDAEATEEEAASEPGSPSMTPSTGAPVEMTRIVPEEVRPPTLTQRWGAGEQADSMRAAPPATAAPPQELSQDEIHVDRYGFVYGVSASEYRRLTQQRSVRTDATVEEAQPISTPSSGDEGAIDATERLEQELDLPVRPVSAADEAEELNPISPGDAVPRLLAVPQVQATAQFSSLNAASSMSVDVATTDGALDRGREGAAIHPPRRLSQTVQRLLRNMHDMYDQQQAERKTRWDAYLAHRRTRRQATARSATRDDSSSSPPPPRPRSSNPLLNEQTEATDEPEEVWRHKFLAVRQLDLGNKADRQDWITFQRLCQGGLPMVYRPAVWAECTRADELAEPGAYAELVAAEQNAAEAGNLPNACVSQILLDVGRTMPSNLFFGGKGPGVPKLRRLLLAYARYDRKCGYCQGMNNLAAILLLTYAGEEEAFWTFVGIIETVLPRGFYASDMLVPQADQRILLGLVRQGLPKLYAHMQELGVELAAVTFSWFLSLFTVCLPIETLFRVLDLLFVDGNITLFRVAFAILSLKSNALLSAQTAGAFYNQLHTVTAHLLDADELINASVALRGAIRAEDIAARRTRFIAGGYLDMEHAHANAAELQRARDDAPAQR